MPHPRDPQTNQWINNELAKRQMTNDMAKAGIDMMQMNVANRSQYNSITDQNIKMMTKHD